MGNQNSRKKNTYKVPPGAGKPDPPEKPTVEYIGDDVMVRWNEPKSNGGCPIIGYVLQFNRVDGDLWESYRVDGTECLLKNLDDTFIFRVVAENLVGYSEPSETSVPVSFEFSEPVLLVPLLNETRAIEFEKVELSCRVWGMPNPELTWYLNGDEIITNNRIFTSTDGIDYKLIFNHIKISDEGEIKVVARNLLGEIESTGSVIIEAPPRIRSPKNYDDGVIVRVGETLRLKFGCHGRPKPEVSWYHDGEPLHRGFKVQEIGDVAVLMLDNMTRPDGGEYTIRVENNIGEDVAHVLVTVIDRPSPPGKPTVIQLSDNSCVLEWDPLTAEEVTTYIVEYFRDGWGVWLKALSTRNRGCKIRDLIPGSKYRFRIKAENHFGTSDCGEESVQIYIPESNKEHGNIMSSIQEDEFEVITESNDDLSFEKLEQIIPPIPETRKPRQGKGYLEPINRNSSHQRTSSEISVPPRSPTRSRVKASPVESSLAQTNSYSTHSLTKPDDEMLATAHRDEPEKNRTEDVMKKQDVVKKPWEITIEKFTEEAKMKSQELPSRRLEKPLGKPPIPDSARRGPWEDYPLKSPSESSRRRPWNDPSQKYSADSTKSLQRESQSPKSLSQLETSSNGTSPQKSATESSATRSWDESSQQSPEELSYRRPYSEVSEKVIDEHVNSTSWESPPSYEEPKSTKVSYSRRDIIKSESWRMSPEKIERPSSAPPTELPQLGSEDHGLYRRTQILGSTPTSSKSNDALHASTTAPSSDSGGNRYFDQYSLAGKKTRGTDRFAKYRQDPKSTAQPATSSNSLNLGSHPGSTEELEQSSKDGGSFVIVEDADDDDEECADCVVSQLIVPVKSGSVKIATSFDNGSAAASSVKSSMDDLTFDLSSRNNTPDFLSSNNRLLHHRRSGDDSSLSRGSSRSNLLQSLAEFTDGRLSSDSKENLDENPFYQEATRKQQAAVAKSKSSAPSESRKNAGGTKMQRSGSAGTAMNEGVTDDVSNELFRGKGGSDGEAPTTSSASSAASVKPVATLSVGGRLKGLLDTTSVFLLLGLLGPLLLMNVYTFALFCLLLIKMTFM